MKRIPIFLLCLILLLSAACKPASAANGTKYTPTPIPTSTPAPTPTGNPPDSLFAKEDQEIVEYKKDGVLIDPYAKGAPFPDYWLYDSHDLRIEIKQYVDSALPEVYYVADIRTRNNVREKALFGSKTPPGTNRNKPGKLARLYGAVFCHKRRLPVL